MRTIIAYVLIGFGLASCGYAMAQEGLKTDTVGILKSVRGEMVPIMAMPIPTFEMKSTTIPLEVK